jgi:hypothetical protein
MKSLKLLTLIWLIACITLFSGCDKVTIIPERPALPVHLRNDKPRNAIETGTIRAYFGDQYLIFKEHIEKVQPIDSFSNCYFYGACPVPFSQINLIRCDSSYVFSMFILGYPLDSLPASLPVKQEYGKYTEMQFSALPGFNRNITGNYSQDDFYGNSVFITDKTDDILSGTFQGTLYSSNGASMPVTDGEFKLKIFRKYMKCGNSGGKGNKLFQK